ncbi:MAG TPA: hypothetical protein DF613_14350 [Lachnospiraceae bacterium]|nr:hypothetical protein [Lachnospiraceae bacterium]
MKTRNCIVAIMLSIVMAVSAALPSVPLAAANTDPTNESAARDVSGTEAPKPDVTPSKPETLEEAQQRAAAAEAELEAAQKLIAELQAAAQTNASELEAARKLIEELQTTTQANASEIAATKELLVNTMGAPTVTLTNTAYNKIRVSWEKMNGVTGYLVYRSTSKNGTYTKIKTAKSADSLYTTNTGLTCGTTYYYKVRAYLNTSSGQILSPFSAVAKLKAKPAPVTISKVTAGKKQAAITLKAQTGVSGYGIYRSTSETGTFKRVKTILSGATMKYTNTKLVSKKTYYYKARAYYSVGSTIVWGAYSPVMSVTVK